MTNTREYGRALFMLTEELGTTDSVLSDVEALRTAIRQNPEYLRLLDSPTLKKEERTALIGEALGILDANLVNLIKILCERHAVRTFPYVEKTYVALYNESRGIEEVTAISAIPMTDAQISALTEKLYDFGYGTTACSNRTALDLKIIRRRRRASRQGIFGGSRRGILHSRRLHQRWRDHLRDRPRVQHSLL